MKILSDAFGVWTASHLRVLWVLMLLPLLWWVVDREPPFTIIEYPATPRAKAGEIVTFDAPVRRDIKRDCSVTWSRYLVDAHGVRHDYSGPNRMSPEAIAAMDTLMNGRVRVDVKLPVDLPKGKANLISVMHYNCNPLHSIVPIVVTANWVLEIV